MKARFLAVGAVIVLSGIHAAPVASQTIRPSVAAENLSPEFIPHRAVYDISLDSSKTPEGIESVLGRIVYEFSGSACTGYELNYRQVIKAGLAGGGINVSDVRSKSREDEAARSFRFSVQDFTDQKLDTDTDGKAEHKQDGTVSVVLKKPEKSNFDLSADVLFPTEQMKALVRTARSGGSVFNSKIYDGSEGGRKVYDTMAVIGRAIADGKPRTGAAGKVKSLDNVARWPVTMSYFEMGKDVRGELTPDYTMSFELYENGVSGDLALDYGDYRLKGALVSLELGEQGKCSK